MVQPCGQLDFLTRVMSFMNIMLKCKSVGRKLRAPLEYVAPSIMLKIVALLLEVVEDYFEICFLYLFMCNPKCDALHLLAPFP